MNRTPRQQVLVTVAELAAELSSPRPPVLLDVRWKLGGTPGAGHARYAVGHLPGARFLDFEAVLADHTGDPLDGRHPLPALAALERGLGRLGVSGQEEVVVYDEAGTYAAERAWWVLRWAGLHVRVLDGGIGAWVAGRGEAALATGDETGWEPATPSLTAGGLPTLTVDECAAFPATGTLLDARAAERYRGETEPIDSRAGHVPGARNLVAADLYTAQGTLPDDEELQARLAAALGETPDDRPLAAYCGSGVSAARDVLALAVLERPVALFPGSWSAWSSDPERPVATGPTP